jgi:hypothetical protein
MGWRRRGLAPALIAATLACCGHRRPPPTSAEVLNDYGYHPVDPLPVIVKAPDGVKVTPKRVLDALPDETMRLAIGEVLANGSVSFGPAKAGYQGRSYLVVLDYVKFDTKSFTVVLGKAAPSERDAKQPAPAGAPDARPSYKIERVLPAERGPTKANGEPSVLVPTYVGIGLRLTASVTVNEGHVDLANLVAIGAAAEAKRVSGTLVVQTLGISGPPISALVPMPSEISGSTIQNAILALGAIKSRLYDEDTDIRPRVVGVYNNLGGGPEIIHTFISKVLANPPELALQP